MTDLASGPVRPAIDPRFVRRWVDARRQEGKRRLRILAAVATIVLLLAAAAGSLFTPLAKVRHVRVQVEGGASPGTIARLAGLSHRSLMIRSDPSRIARRLDAVTYLGGARVRRVWPSTLDISVDTREPVVLAAVASGPEAGEWTAIDPTGRVLSESPVATRGMPVVYGLGAPPSPGGWLAGSPGPDAPVGGGGIDMNATSDSPSIPSGVSLALGVVDGLTAPLRAEVVSVTVAQGGAVSLGVLPANIPAGSIPVQLGDGSQLASKVAALASLLTEADLSGVTSINLSVPDRPALLTAR